MLSDLLLSRADGCQEATALETFRANNRVQNLTSAPLKGMFPLPYVARAQSSQRLRDLGLRFRVYGFRVYRVRDLGFRIYSQVDTA